MTQLVDGGEHPLMFIGKVEERRGIRPNLGDHPWRGLKRGKIDYSAPVSGVEAKAM